MAIGKLIALHRGSECLLVTWILAWFGHGSGARFRHVLAKADARLQRAERFILHELHGSTQAPLPFRLLVVGRLSNLELVLALCPDLYLGHDG